MNKNKPIGDWQSDTMVHNLHHKIATKKWTKMHYTKMFPFEAPVPVGMEKLLQKLESAQNRSFKVIPRAVRDKFSILETTNKSSDYEDKVFFSSTNYADFRLLYCRAYTLKQNLKEPFWSKPPEKLSHDNICRVTPWAFLGIFRMFWAAFFQTTPNNLPSFAYKSLR